MTSISLTLYREKINNRESLDFSGLHNALWVQSGRLTLDDAEVTQGNGIYWSPGRFASCHAEPGSEILRFCVAELSDPAPSPGNVEMLLTNTFELDGNDVFLRLDQITFPLGARAYRHVHPGPGIRYLMKGALEIQTDHDATLISSGQAWFEGANSPVQATADTRQPTAFVRAMVLPQEFFGKPTIKYLDAVDDPKPRLQTNHRFFDQVIDI
jgi:quercetin dioxygenase-like cupin family protein